MTLCVAWIRQADDNEELAFATDSCLTGGEIFDYSYHKISKYLDNYPREFFGHGLGIGSHEQPRMNKVNKTILEPDTPVCLETSYYHNGVRFHSEETFLVTDSGVEHWTADCPRDLIVPV